MKSKIIATLIALTMLGQVTITVNANAINISGGTGESSALLNQEQTGFNVTVPTSLPITVDSAGVVTTATDVEIHNNSYGPVIISDIRVNVANGWSIVDFNKDMSKSLFGLKEFGFSIQDDVVQTDGGISLTPASWESIPGNGSIYLNYDAIVSPQKTALTDVNIANVVFILGWDEIYTLATDADFIKEDGIFKYIGTDEYVEIPHVIQGESVTSYERMFQGKSVKGVKSTNTNVTNMNSMFGDCYDLTTLDLSNFDTTNVTDMNNMFNSCRKLTTLDLSNFDTSNVTDMSYMFDSCYKLKTLDLSSFDTSNVTNMGRMFNVCLDLTTLDLSNFDTSNVASMSMMFDNCSSLTTLDLSSFNTINVTDMKQMFYNCRSLTTLDLSNFNTGNVTNMKYMFIDCSNLTSLDLSNFDTSNVTDMRFMFQNCSSLTTLDLSSFNTSNVTIVSNMRYMFDNCTSLQPVYVRTQEDANKFNSSEGKPTWLTFIVKDEEPSKYTLASDDDFSGTEDGTFHYTGTDEYVEIPHVIKGKPVTSYQSMFRGTSVKGVKSTNTNVTDMSFMFYECSNLTSLDLSNFDTSNVTDMNYMFKGCPSLTNLDLSNFNTGNVHNMCQMFYECSNLTSLDLSKFDTSNVTDLNFMFYGCSNLTSLDLSSFDTINVTNMIAMFRDCTSLQTLDLSSFDTTNVTDMSQMFISCRSLTTLDLSNFDTSNVTTVEYMFMGCTSLKTSYARTQEDAGKFNSSSSCKPEGLTFIVKE